ncbi:MAG: hypothetical protein ACOVO1_05505 [Chitinophagaceae bacterium]
MKYILLSFLLVLFFCYCNEFPKETGEIQKDIATNLDSVNKNIGILTAMLENADSVILVSHIDNSVEIKKIVEGKVTYEYQPLCDSFNPNPKIIKERKK